MSQLFDYFVCSRQQIEEWADALEQADEDAETEAEGRMPRKTTLSNLGDVEFNILASCTNASFQDVVEAVVHIELVRAISDEEGPWIMALGRPSIEAVASVAVDESLLERWRKAVAEFNGDDEEYYRDLLTTEAAETLRELCQQAINDKLDLFVCSYL